MSQTKAQLLDNIKDNVQLDARNSLRFADTDSSHYVAFKAPATVSSNVTWTLPSADGSANYVLATDGSGTLSWIADPAGQWTTSGSNIYFTGGNVGIGDSSPSNPLSVTGASAFNGDVTLTGASYNVTWDKSADDLIFNDNAKAAFGTSSDLSIYHDGSNSFIDDSGTGNLVVRSSTIAFENAPGGGESLAKFIGNGAVELYHDNTKRFETTGSGITVTGGANFSSNVVVDNGTVRCNSGFSSDTDLIFNSDANANGSSAIIFQDGGSEKARITSGNIRIANDSGKIQLGASQDLSIYHDGSGSQITNSTGYLVIQSDDLRLRDQASGHPYLKGVADGAVELYWNNAKKLDTYEYGVNVTGNITTTSHVYWGDNGEAIFGAGSDLKIFHDGSHSRIYSLTGNISCKANAYYFNNASGTENCLDIVQDGAVSLYYDNAKVFYTEAYGAVVKRPSGGSTVLEVYGSEGENAEINLKADDGDDSADRWKIKANASSSLFEIQDYASGTWVSKIQVQGGAAGAVFLSYGNSQKLYTTSAGVTVSGTITSEVTGTSMVAATFINSGSTSDGTEVQIRNDTNTPADGDQTGYLQFSGKDSNGNSTIYNAIIGYTDDVTDGTEDGSLKFFCRSNGTFTQRLVIAADGTFTGSGSNDISDQRLKDNIATVVDPIGKIKALKGRTFTWKPEANLSEGTKYGFIAQEVEAVVSDLVDNKHGLRQFDKDNNLIPQDEKAKINKDEGTTEAKAVHATGVVPILVEALKEALTKIETLETKVSALESA